jgi:sensor histidine kinase regulating citrate/malate metabolism
LTTLDELQFGGWQPPVVLAENELREGVRVKRKSSNLKNNFLTKFYVKTNRAYIKSLMRNKTQEGREKMECFHIQPSSKVQNESSSVGLNKIY